MPKQGIENRISIGALLVTGALAISNSALAQQNEERTTTTTTTTSAGTVSQFGPEGIVIKTTTSADPVRYSSSKTTTYVDENGKAVSVKTVKSGLPVTIYYTKAGDKLVASKVVVRKAVGESGATEITETTQHHATHGALERNDPHPAADMHELVHLLESDSQSRDSLRAVHRESARWRHNAGHNHHHAFEPTGKRRELI